MFLRSHSAWVIFRSVSILVILAIPAFSGVAPAGAMSTYNASKLMTICQYGEVQCKAEIGLTAVGDRLFFLADHGEHGREIWVSDGSPEGTHLVKDIFSGDLGFPASESSTWARAA